MIMPRNPEKTCNEYNPVPECIRMEEMIFRSPPSGGIGHHTHFAETEEFR